MKKFILLLLLLPIVGCSNTTNNGVGYNKKIKINSIDIMVDIADNDYSRIAGLSNRDEMCANCGMLFIFDNSDMHSFWMKDMRFPIDIIWIKNNRIVEIMENIEIPSNGSIKSYRPVVPSDMVLEVNSGFVGKNNINIGDKILTKKE